MRYFNYQSNKCFISGFLPVTSSNRSDNTFSSSPVMDTKNGFDMQTWAVDYDYINTMGMHITKGRCFSKDFGSDSSAVIINEATAKNLGWDDPIGKKIYSTYYSPNNDRIGYTIIGVVKNFNFESLKQNVGLLWVLPEKQYWPRLFQSKCFQYPGCAEAGGK